MRNLKSNAQSVNGQSKQAENAKDRPAANIRRHAIVYGTIPIELIRPQPAIRHRNGDDLKRRQMERQGQHPRLRRKIKIRPPQEEPADPIFCELLGKTQNRPLSSRHVWEHLIAYVGAVQPGEDPDGTWRVISFCYRSIDYLDDRDAKFITNMVRLVNRYPVTAKQRKWIMDIFHRLQPT